MSAHEREQPIEEMKAEFVGGAFDGERLTLKVVRESARNHRVLEVAYERPWIRDAGLPTGKQQDGADR